jgi:hypothetical protein
MNKNKNKNKEDVLIDEILNAVHKYVLASIELGKLRGEEWEDFHSDMIDCELHKTLIDFGYETFRNGHTMITRVSWAPKYNPNSTCTIS